jgi:hypothetical protein
MVMSEEIEPAVWVAGGSACVICYYDEGGREEDAGMECSCQSGYAYFVRMEGGSVEYAYVIRKEGESVE